MDTESAKAQPLLGNSSSPGGSSPSSSGSPHSQSGGRTFKGATQGGEIRRGKHIPLSTRDDDEAKNQDRRNVEQFLGQALGRLPHRVDLYRFIAIVIKGFTETLS